MKDFLKAIVYGGVFAVPFITLLVANDLFFPFITGKNYTFRVLVGVMFFAWIALALLDVRYRPKFSWMLGGFAALLVVMFFANLTGAHPPTSFWSNFERMDGYVTLVHLFLYILIAGTMLQNQQQWTWFWYTSLTVATAVALHGLGQYVGLIDGGGTRISGRLGNAAYMAIYMLFHIFLVFYLFVRESRIGMRVLYGVIALVMTFVLLETGTRGTAIGLAVGVGVMTAYTAVFAARFPQFRNAAIGTCALFVLIIGGFLMAQNSQFVQDSRTLSRIANIDLQQDLEVRMAIWSIAWQGVQDRPLLGWGQENFNFVFNQYYDPFLYDQEQWFDRVHNIFLDWLIAGGILGLLAYLVVFFSAVYYVARHTARKPEDQGFTVLEQGVLLGLLAGYLTHNFVVFDNIVSYLFFAAVLAMIHSRVARDIPVIRDWRVPKNTVKHTVLPMLIVVGAATVYYVNVPSLQAAAHIITAMRSEAIEDRMLWFREAFERAGGVGRQEVTEQMAQSAIQVAAASQLPESVRQQYVAHAELMLEQVVNTKPNDARIHVFRGSFYRGIGALNEARAEFATARALSPSKQSIIMQQGVTELQLQEFALAKEFFANALELDTRNDQARQFLVATLYRLDEIDLARSYLEEGSERFIRTFATDEYAFQSVAQAEDYLVLADLYETRIAADPSNPQDWTSWAVTYLEMGDAERAVEIFEQASEELPEFASTAGCYASNIEAGSDPEDGCH